MVGQGERFDFKLKKMTGGKIAVCVKKGME